MCQFEYTLIIPHYNSPDLLSRLLQTVPKRKDLQVIVVDDCSTTQLEKLDTIKDQYPHISFLSTSTNGGGGKARNVGLSHAKGRYVFFAHSDDYFTPGINQILDLYCHKTEEYDIIFFNAQAVNSDTYELSQRVKHLKKYLNLYSLNPQKSVLQLRFLFGEPWCKIIKRDLIEENGIYFEELKVHNDTYFSYMVGYYAKKIQVCPIVGYMLTEREISVSTYVFSEKWNIRTEVFAKKNRFLEDNGIPIFDDLLLSSFTTAYKYNRKSLKGLYSIAQKYGYNKMFIIKKLFRIGVNRIIETIKN